MIPTELCTKGRRRGRLLMGLAVLIVAAVTATVPLAGAEPDASDTPSTDTTATTVADANVIIAIVGDSLTVGTEPYLTDALEQVGLPPAEVSAAKSRGISTKARDDDFTGLTAVDDIRARAGEPDRWIIALGTNDAFLHARERYEAEIGALLDRIGPGRHVRWVDVALPDEPELETAWNGALAAVAAARPGDITVVEWSATAAARPDWFATDQIHLIPAGYHARATAVAEAAARAAAADAGEASDTSEPADSADASESSASTSTTTTAAPASTPATLPPVSLNPTPPAASPTATVPAATVPAATVPAAVPVTVPSPVPLASTPAGFVPVPATRALDTRIDASRLTAGAPRPVDLSAALPEGATGVAATLTVTGADGPGQLTAWPCDRPQPTTINLSFAAGATASSLVLSGVDPGRQLCVASTAGADLIVDAAGGFTSDGALRLEPSNARRLVDTRRLAIGPATNAGMWFSVGAEAALLSIITTGATTAGDLVVWPCGDPRPATTNGQVRPDRTDVHAALVPAGTDGRVCLATTANTHVVVSLMGAFTSGEGLGFMPVDPTRVYDTAASGALPAGSTATVATNSAFVVGSLTAASSTATTSGWAALWSGAGTAPIGATVSAPAGETVTGFAAATAAETEGVATVTAGGAGDWSIAVDVTGVFTA